METKYYIYHIPTYVHKDGKIGKIGVSDDLKTRMPLNLKTSQHPFDFWEVLEEHTDIMKVSKREIELQKQYGYKVDRIPYWQSREMAKTGAGGRVGGKIAVESGQLSSIRTKENQGRKNVESGHISALGKSSRKLTFEDAQFIREVCAKKQYKQNELAERYGVTPPAISLIIHNKTYTQP